MCEVALILWAMVVCVRFVCSSASYYVACSIVSFCCGDCVSSSSIGLLVGLWCVVAHRNLGWFSFLWYVQQSMAAGRCCLPHSGVDRRPSCFLHATNAAIPIIPVGDAVLGRGECRRKKQKREPVIVVK